MAYTTLSPVPLPLPRPMCQRQVAFIQETLDIRRLPRHLPLPAFGTQSLITVTRSDRIHIIQVSRFLRLHPPH